MKIGEELLRALKTAGAKAVFGLPGDYALPFFHVIERSGLLPLFTMSHEPAVGFAADGAARQGGGVGVAVVTYGAGAMNMVNPVACAWAEHSPLVIISGAPGTGEMARGLMLHHQIRTSETQMNVFKEFTCDQARLDDPQKAAAEIARVIGACVKHSRPVYIELPRDMVDMTCSSPVPGFVYQDVPPEDVLRECLQDVEKRLRSAKSPALLAGARVRRFGLEESVFRLASDWQIPLLNAFMGKGLFAGRGAPYMGSYLGLAGREDLRAAVEDSDLLFTLGVIPCDTNWGLSGQRVDEKNTIFVTEDTVLVCGKKYEGISLRSLIPALHQIRFSSGKKISAAPTPVRKSLAGSPEMKPDDVPPVLQAFLEKKTAAMPVVSDIGDCLFMTMELEGVPVLASGYYATMGFSVPAAIGLQAATGTRPLVLTGDGGFQMTGWELLNAARYALDPVVVVLNNGSWEMLRQFDPDSRYTKISAPDYARIFEAAGCAAVRVCTPSDFAAALETADRARGRPFLIETMLPAGICTSTMKRFAEAIKKNVIRVAA